MKAMRDQLGDSLVEAGKRDPNLVVLDADLSSSTRTSQFQKYFPDRFFNCGIAEQNMIGTAMGLALRGKNVVVSGFTIFTLGRAWDFIRTAAYDDIPLKLCLTHAGLSAGLDGATHQCLEDLALACSIPKLNIIVPADALETKQVMDYVLGTKRMFFVRLTRNAVPETLPAGYQFHFGEAQEILPGQDVTLFACGSLVQIAVSAAKELKKNGISAQVINVSTIKPLESANLVKFTRQTGCALVAEEHNKLIGLGAQISRSMAEIYPIPMEFVGIEDSFGQTGLEEDLFQAYGLTSSRIIEKVMQLLQRKK